MHVIAELAFSRDLVVMYDTQNVFTTLQDFAAIHTMRPI